MKENVNHPSHYGGQDNVYEVIKVIEAWKLGFNLGNAVKCIGRAGKKDPEPEIEDLKKAVFYLNREIENRVKELAAGEPFNPLVDLYNRLKQWGFRRNKPAVDYPPPPPPTGVPIEVSIKENVIFNSLDELHARMLKVINADENAKCIHTTCDIDYTANTRTCCDCKAIMPLNEKK